MCTVPNVGLVEERPVIWPPMSLDKTNFYFWGFVKNSDFTSYERRYNRKNQKCFLQFFTNIVDHLKQINVWNLKKKLNEHF